MTIINDEKEMMIHKHGILMRVFINGLIWKKYAIDMNLVLCISAILEVYSCICSSKSLFYYYGI